jgi:hypothetical protein
MTPDRERERSNVVDAFDLASLRADPAFARISEVIAAICNAEMASLTLMEEERQCLAASFGIDGGEEIPREHTFCTYTMADGDMMVVEDLSEDERFEDNPFVLDDDWHIRFYAGATLLVDGVPVGTLCVMAPHPRRLDSDDRASLFKLVRQLETHLGFIYRYDIPDGLRDVLSRLTSAVAELEQIRRRAGRSSQHRSFEMLERCIEGATRTLGHHFDSEDWEREVFSRDVDELD